jgi:hypothetical protein
MTHRTTRVRRIVTAGTAPIAILVAGLLVWQGSTAAFTSQTRNIGNSWETGSVFLTDDDLGAAAFQISDVLPGQSGAKCITVTSTSSVAGEVRMYMARLGSDGLENAIKVSLELGSGGSFAGGCATFVPDIPDVTDPIPVGTLAALYTDYTTGGLPWATTGDENGESRTYRVTWVFDTTGLTQAQVDGLQGKSVSADVVWELQTD